MSQYAPENPLIVQGDHTILVEVASPRYGEVRDRLQAFAELVKSPEHVHTYRITPLSIWNACAAEISPRWIADTLREFAKYPVPDHVLHEVSEYASRFGRLKLRRSEGDLLLWADEPALAEEISRHRLAGPLLGQRLTPLSFSVDPALRGRLKQALVKAGFPAQDLAGYLRGDELRLRLREHTLQGRPFSLRDYQQRAARAFHAGGRVEGGSGVVVLPCGAGKTIVAMGVMAELQCSTLILTTGITASRQWMEEILDKTTLQEHQIGEYSGHNKEVRPITVATYNIMTYRRPGEDQDFLHLGLFDRRNWGLIIYDEVHLLPAPVFQVTASLQARRRLGLTATLVREDGREDDVFALIGPKKADVPWRELEAQGWIAAAACCELRVPLPPGERMKYAMADPRAKARVAAENPRKLPLVRRIMRRHEGQPTLIIGTYVDQLRSLGEDLDIPVLTGATPQSRRDQYYRNFKSGRLKALAVSKIANFSVDLPDAAVAIQISGTFGSRQEEAQRLGRVLRPKPGANQAHFYSLVSRDTIEQSFALKRQLFLCEQGYQYRIEDLSDDLQPRALSTQGRPS
ncbi:MAG TPA: DNA repair helicase XPB [Acidobacteriota bacterium]|nr:DNA repair helicase XPB [Acidobacteriota bacterium]